MATAKKAAPAKTSKKPKATEAAPEDDLLAPKAKGKAKAAAPEDDLLATKGKKAAPAKKAPAKKAAKAEDEASADDVRAVLLKTRKATSYTDIAEANGFNIRMVRRQARSLRDSGEVEITKEGTLGYVKVVKK
jgi:hypothetical protein